MNSLPHFTIDYIQPGTPYPDEDTVDIEPGYWVILQIGGIDWREAAEWDFLPTLWLHIGDDERLARRIARQATISWDRQPETAEAALAAAAAAHGVTLNGQS